MHVLRHRIKSMIVATKLFLRQMFVATGIIFHDKLLSRQIRVCRDKTRLLCRQKYAFRDKNILRRVLSRQTNTDIGTGDKA